MNYFKNNNDVYGFDLADPQQCIAALAKVNPALHADWVAARQAFECWRAADYAVQNWRNQKARHDHWLAHKAAYDAWVAAGQLESDSVPAPSPEPVRPGEQPPDPGPQPPTVPAVSANDVLQGLSDGWVDVTGNWPPPPPIADVRADAKARIEAAFGAAMAPYLPRLPGYELREAQALAYKGAGYAGEVPGQVAAFQAAAGLTPRVATDTILSQAAAFRTALDALEARRMRKFEVEVMTDAAAIQAKAAQIAGEIKAIAAML